MKGHIHSLQSLGTVDGPGVRAVVFTEGCPLRCVYCHNPDTWQRAQSDLTEHTELAGKILRLYPYIKDGGVTFSGGEPCLEADFILEVVKILKNRGLHIAIDTCGDVYNASVERLLAEIDLVLLDIKMTDEESYKKYTGGSLQRATEFLGRLDEMGKDTWVRHVVVPGINDTVEDIERLAELVRPYRCVKRTELLPFKTLCREKYKALGIPFALADTPQMSESILHGLQAMLDEKLSL